VGIWGWSRSFCMQTIKIAAPLIARSRRYKIAKVIQEPRAGRAATLAARSASGRPRRAVRPVPFPPGPSGPSAIAPPQTAGADVLRETRVATRGVDGDVPS
jgi:hypothetical protein